LEDMGERRPDQCHLNACNEVSKRYVKKPDSAAFFRHSNHARSSRAGLTDGKRWQQKHVISRLTLRLDQITSPNPGESVKPNAMTDDTRAVQTSTLGTVP
jgi:hypothetical protein